MSRDMFNYIHDQSPPPLESSEGLELKGIGSKKAAGCIHLPFWVPGKDQNGNSVNIEMSTTFHIVDDLGEGCLLGLDVIGHYKIDALFTTSTARVTTEKGTAEFPIAFCRGRLRSNTTNHPNRATVCWSRAMRDAKPVSDNVQEVRVRGDEWVPPNSHRFVKVNLLKGKPKDSWKISPRTTTNLAWGKWGSTQSCLLRTDHTGKKGVGVLFSNFGDHPIRLTNGMSIADAYPICPGDIMAANAECFTLSRDVPAERPSGEWTPKMGSYNKAQARQTNYELETEPMLESFDPHDLDEEELEKSRAQVEKEVPSSEHTGCRIAHNASGVPYPEICSLLERHKQAFSLDGSPGRVITDEPVTIELDDSQAKKLKPENLRPLGHFKRNIEKQELEKLQKLDCIEPSRSRLAFPIVIVKQGDKFRYCVDYRSLNRATIPEAYPMQRADTVFASLGGMAFFSALDAARGYHQLPVKEEDRWKTAFITHHGLFQYKVMPFGLRNAPAIFQSFMDRYIIGGLKWKAALVYIDDVIVFSRTMEEHCKALEEILSAAERVGLKFSAQKCFFAYPSLKLLGRMISHEGISVVEDKAKAVRELARPETLGDLYMVIGLMGYYRGFIIAFARKIAPLTNLTKGLAYKQRGDRWVLTKKGDPNEEPLHASKMKLDWGVEQERAFQALKEDLVNPPVFAYPQDGAPVILYANASLKGICGIAHQVFAVPKDGRDHAAEGQALTANAAKDALTERLVTGIRNDPTFKDIYAKAQDSPSEVPLYHIDQHGRLCVDSGQPPRWCLPETLLGDTLRDFHDRLGHPGTAKTIQNIVDRFWRPNLRRAVERYVLDCPSCQKSKPSRRLKPGVIERARDVPPRAFAVVSMDLVTGLPTAGKTKNNAVLIVQCLWTKTVILVPTLDTLNAEGLAELWLEHVACRGFAPSTIISDMGPQFISDVWKRLQERLGASLIFSAPYHQQANPVERAVQTVEVMLRTLCDNHPSRWRRLIKFAELCVNSNKSDATGQSPFDLLYTSYNSAWLHPTDDLPLHESDVTQRVDERVAAARDALEKAAAKMKKAFNRSHRPPPEYHVGNWVLVRVKDRPLDSGDQNLHKLKHIKRGPFRVRKVLSRVAVELDLSTEGGSLVSKTPPVFTVDQLEEWKGPAPTTTESAIPAAEETADRADAPHEGRPSRGKRVTFDARTHEPRTHAVVGSRAWLDETFGQPPTGMRWVEKPIAYHSRQLRKAEHNYYITELELAGVCDSILKLRFYVEGCKVVVVTDHSPLTSILTSRSEMSRNQRVERFRLLLQGFDMSMIYRPGKTHCNADALSRLTGPLFDLAATTKDPGEIFEGPEHKPPEDDGSAAKKKGKRTKVKRA